MHFAAPWKCVCGVCVLIAVHVEMAGGGFPFRRRRQLYLWYSRTATSMHSRPKVKLTRYTRAGAAVAPVPIAFLVVVVVVAVPVAVKSQRALAGGRNSQKNQSAAPFEQPPTATITRHLGQQALSAGGGGGGACTEAGTSLALRLHLSFHTPLSRNGLDRARVNQNC